MIVSTIKQFGFRLRADPEEIPFQYSANVQMKFEKDEIYSDYTVVGYYIPPGESEAKLLSINDEGVLTLGPDCFKNRGTLSFSFNLINSQEEVHLGSIDFEVRYSFGDGDTILPEPEEVWISLVTQVAKDAIKEDVAVVQQKAKEALQSASLANDKASEAQEYANNANQSANSASLSASSALSAKNDAIVASGSAIQAKQDAEQSANNAKNSADTALANANKSNEAIKTVTQIKTEIENKANDFDNSVQTANTNFDNKVTQANSDLDAKVQEANTTIDEKVKTATEQAQKATNEANRAEQALENKLDRNQGAENVGLTLVVGKDGNLELGESTPKDVYTKEEVDYLLADKMDKPYVPITITDSATLDDCLAGNFKIDMIKGNTIQKVETDIVPTPEQSIPINSRKVKAGDGYVELRSLKETGNLWDSTNMRGKDRNDIVIQSWASNIINLDDSFIKLKASTRYTIKFDIEMIEAINDDSFALFDYSKRLLLYRTSTNELPAVNINLGQYKEAMTNGEVKSVTTTITTPPDTRGLSILAYAERWTDTSGKVYSANVKFKNIMIVEGESAPSTYIPPTVRDYKIVDYETKTAKIVRNVGVVNLNAITWKYGSRDLNHIRLYGNAPAPLKYVAQKTYCNIFESFYEKFNYSKQGIYCGNTSGGTTISIMVNSSVFNGYGQEEFDRLFKEYINNPNAITLYPLATSIEEPIEYLETDTNEIGSSWQDTISPSPTIESPIRPVEKIDILKTGKNLFDIESAKDKSNWEESIKQVGYIDFMIKVIKGKQYAFSYRDKLDLGLRFYAGIVNSEDITNNDVTNWIYHTSLTGLINNCITFIAKGNYISLRVNNGGFDKMFENFKDIQLELSDTRTTYEPYMGQRVNITLPQPLYENDVANVESGEYEYEKQKYIVTGNEEFINDYQTQSGFYGRYLFLKNGVQDGLGKCNCFKHTSGIWHMASEGFCQNSGDQIHLKFSNDRLGITDNTPLEEKRTAFANYLKQLYASENPLYVVIKVAKTTQPIPEEDLSKLKLLKTNAGVNNIFINGEVKPIIEARYPQDVVSAVNKLQTKLLTLQEEVVKNV